MDIPDVERVILSCQAVESRSAFKTLELTMLLTLSWLVLAPFDRVKLRRIRAERAAEAKTEGLGRFQQLMRAAQAPFAMVDGYLDMTLTAVREELPTAHILGARDIMAAELRAGTEPSRFTAHTAGEPPHKLDLHMESGIVNLQIDGHTEFSALTRALRNILGDRLNVM